MTVENNIIYFYKNGASEFYMIGPNKDICFFYKKPSEVLKSFLFLAQKYKKIQKLDDLNGVDVIFSELGLCL